MACGLGNEKGLVLRVAIGGGWVSVRFGRIWGLRAVRSKFLAGKQAEDHLTNEARAKRNADDTGARPHQVAGSLQQAQAVPVCKGSLDVPAEELCQMTGTKQGLPGPMESRLGQEVQKQLETVQGVAKGPAGRRKKTSMGRAGFWGN